MVSLPRAPRAYTQPTDQTRIELLWNGTFNTLASAAFVNQNFGVAGPGLNIPKYWGQFFGIYKFAYLEKVTMTVEIANIGARPMRVVMAESNTADVIPTSYLELSQTPRAKTKIVLNGGNHAVVTMAKSTTASAIMGHKLEDDSEFWCTAVSGPTAAVLPLLVLGFEPIVPASTIDYSWQVKLKYDIKFFTLNHL
jgi:hypothetical protein